MRLASRHGNSERSSGGSSSVGRRIQDIDLDTTESMMVWMRESEVTTGKVGLFGSLRGAEHALLVTSLMARDGSGGLPRWS